MDLDFLSAILDEVALEGLDGITVPMLWVRLENRINFPIALDDDSKRFLWECIAAHKDVEIFKLPKSRILEPLYNRYEHIDSELGIVVESTEKINDLYPIHFVKDGDVRGSCATYESRVCITSEIRDDDGFLMSLDQAYDKWGETLVLVASSRVRLLALIGTEINPLVEMSQEEYCLLERIGRSRYHGEVTQGEGGLLSLKAPFCKQLHYYRKKLTLKGLVTKQMHYLKSKKGVETTGSLFHLTRFYVPHKTKMEVLMKIMCDALKEKPQNREICKKLRNELDIRETTFKKLFYRPFQKWVKIMNIPYREFCPQATDKESFTANGQDRMVKVVQLLKHCDEGENNDDEETLEEKEPIKPPNIYFDFSKIYHDLPLITQVYRIIQEAGPEGVCSYDIGRIITLPKLDIRTLLKSLIKKKLVVTILQEKGRQKETKYIAKNFGEQNEAYSKIKEGEENFNQENVNSKVQQDKKRKSEESNDNDKDLSENKKARLDEVEKVASELPSSDESKVDFKKIIYEVSEIKSYSVFTGKAPKLVNLTDEVNTFAPLAKRNQITYRKMKRLNMISDILRTSGFSTLTELQKHLIDKEKEEGYSFKLDKKSTARMVHYLFRHNKLKIFKAVLKLDSQKTEIEFICDNSMKPDDPSIQVAVEQAKFKFFSISKDKSKKSDKDVGDTKLSDNKVNDEDKDLKEKPKEINSNLLLNQKALHDLQVHPKFLRLKNLHKFLFYLVYEYEGHSGDSSRDPVIYHDSMSWKRFVPPLPSDHKEGWCFLADVYHRMPLSVFVKIVNLRQRIKEFSEYLFDEEKCNYLITYLPKYMLKSLLNSRKYLFAVDEVMKYLCYMGLISYGPQVSKCKDQIYVYVHKNSSILDTTISPPGYLHISTELVYEKKTFSFCTLADVEKFWVELEHISSNTPLGKYSCVVGKTIAVTEANHKPELLETLKHRSFDNISDKGHVPGDGLGAGGFDSSLFLHSRRNWQPSNFTKFSEKTDKSVTNVSLSISIQNLLKNNEMVNPAKRNRLQRLGRVRLVTQKDKTLKENLLKKNKSEKTNKKRKLENIKPVAPPLVPKKRRRIKFRTVKSRTKKLRTPYHDEKDRVAMEEMSKMRSRCEWSAQEDSFLLLCKVASSFLDPSSRTLVVPYTVVRDLLHEHFPHLSFNKSSRACQRRVRYMMLNPTTTNNVAVFLGEAKQDFNLVRKFDKAKPPKTHEAEWKTLFTDLLKSLLEKFTLPAADRCKNMILPDSMDAFKKSFEIMSPRNVFHYKSNHKDPDNEDELMYCVLYSLIVSAMAIIHDGTEWSYLLYKLYHVYPEYVLRSVVSRLRTERVIACKKSKCKKDFQPCCMTTFPYRFSVTYENSLITKFPIRLFDDAKELLDKFKCIKNKGNIQLQDDIAPGYTAAVICLNSKNEITLSIKIPDQIILFDSSLSKEARTNIVERMMHSLSDKESDELSKLLSTEKESLTEDHQTLTQRSDENEAQKNSKVKSGDSTQVTEVQRSTNASRFALYLLRQELSQPPIERVQHSQDYIVLNSCQVFCHPKSENKSKELSNTISGDQNVSHLYKNKNEGRGKILTDGCISEIKTSLTTFIPPESFTQYDNFDEPLEVIYDAYSQQTLNDAKLIFEHIFKAYTVGISEKELWKKFTFLSGELSLFEHLHLFKEAVLVIRAGVASFVYVCILFAKPWVLTSYAMPEICYLKRFKNSNNETDVFDQKINVNKSGLSHKSSSSSQMIKNVSVLSMEDSSSNFPDVSIEDFPNDVSATMNLKETVINFSDEIYFLPRTWRHPDGTLNKKVFIELLQTVLSYIIHSPGVSTSRVTERFSLNLQPVQTLELLEVLEKSCCIVKYYCKKPKKVSLFSPTATIFITKNPEPDDLDHLESLTDAISNLSRLQEAIL